MIEKISFVGYNMSLKQYSPAVMAMWELVSGGAACAVPGSTSPSNPLDALANALIGSSSKTQRKALRNTNCNHYDIRWQFICRGGKTLRRCHSRVGAGAYTAS
ncbi:hypothetical protein OROMI_017623 [Orobanche minor]